MPTTTKRSLRYPPGTGVTPDVARDLGYLVADLEDEVGVVPQRAVLVPGLVGQTRAGRQLAVQDFTDCGAAAPIGLYNCGDTSDASGNGYTLTNKSGLVAFGVGIEGAASTAAVLTGASNQGLYRSDSGGADPFRIKTGSVGAWFKSPRPNSGMDFYAISKYRATGNQRAYRLGTDPTDKPRLTISTDGTTTNDLIGATPLCDDRWHFLVGTYDGSVMRLYVDGQTEGEKYVTTGPIFSGSGPLNVGAGDLDAATSGFGQVNGRVDEAFVTADVLSPEQVRHLYGVKLAHGGSSPRRASLRVTRRRLGAALANGDFPSNPAAAYNLAAGSLTELNGGTALSATGGVTTVAGPSGEKEAGIYMASGNHLQRTDAGLPSGTASRSYGCWFNVPEALGAAQNLIAWGTNATNHASTFVEITGELVCKSGADIITGPYVCDGQWHHFLVVEDNAPGDGVKRKLYLDGKLVGGSTTLTSLTLIGVNGFRVGASTTGTQPLSGSVSRPFIHASAFTWEQLQAVYLKSAAALAASPKDAADHVEMLGGTSLIFVGDDLDPQSMIDLEVSR